MDTTGLIQPALNNQPSNDTKFKNMSCIVSAEGTVRLAYPPYL